MASCARIVLAVLVLFNTLTLSAGSIAYGQGPKTNRQRTVNAQSVAEATITLNEQFLNSFLEAMFTRVGEPEFPLSIVQNKQKTDANEVKASHAAATNKQSCSSVIVLERERNGVKTSVHFENGLITAPLAFSGSYNAGLLGCFNFNGWADSVITLEFDPERQAVVARVQVQDVQLNGIPRLANGVVVNLVQSTIDKRFNPYELFKTDQLSPIVPIKAAGGSLRLRAREMRPEVIPGAVRIHVFYEFERAG